MKQALSPEVPARVRSQFRALYLGIGTSLLAAACSFGQVDDDANIDPVDITEDEGNGDQPGEVDVPGDVEASNGGGNVDPARPSDQGNELPDDNNPQGAPNDAE